MKKKVIILAINIIMCFTLFAQNILHRYCPHPEIDEEACGYLNNQNELVIPIGKYSKLYSEVFDKIAFVSIKGKQGIYAINRKEQVLFQIFSIDNGPDYVSEGLFRIIRDGKIGFANMNGQIIIKPQFQFVYPFQKNGYAVFCEGAKLVKFGNYSRFENGKWGIIDKYGNVVVPAKYYEGGKSNGLKEKGQWFKLEDIINQSTLTQSQYR